MACDDSQQDQGAQPHDIDLHEEHHRIWDNPEEWNAKWWNARLTYGCSQRRVIDIQRTNRGDGQRSAEGESGDHGIGFKHSGGHQGRDIH